MEKDRLEIILENVMNENSDMDLFTSKIDPINVYIYGIENWDKYKSAVGDRKVDDTLNDEFKVVWFADFEYKSDGIYGLYSDIKGVYGSIDLIVYDDESSSDMKAATLEFGDEDLKKMKIVNEPKMTENHQLIVNGVDIDFKRNTVTIEYF